MPVNIEIKARCPDPEKVRAVLAESGAARAGLDHQIDTYFRVPEGRLKLRQGTIENNLIFYARPNDHMPKRSDVLLHPTERGETLKAILEEALAVKCVVDKKREIFFHGNVKFHIDEVAGLGNFVEIEVIERGDAVDESAMLAVCREWMESLDIDQVDLIAESYSDMLGGND